MPSDLDFDMSAKKKKKKKAAILLEDELGDDAGYATSDSWGASERDYTYEEVGIIYSCIMQNVECRCIVCMYCVFFS